MKNERKVFVLGVDGMDPRMTKKYLDAGKMPHLKKFIERGACREDLVMLGGVPTITPPMWTTLATGANPATHGITDFWGQDPENLDTLLYNMDSTRCKAEQMWNVTALVGKKTLVWHWPGGAWPPSLDNENLHVVDGVQPAALCVGSANVDGERLCLASTDYTEIRYVSALGGKDTGAGCIINDLGEEHHHSEDDEEEEGFDLAGNLGSKTLVNIELDIEDGEAAGENMEFDRCETPITDAHGWAFDVPAGSKEFVFLTSGGKTRRVGLITKNAAGIYDTVTLYKNKKTETPLCVLTKENNFVIDVIDDVALDEGTATANRIYALVDLDESGNSLCFWMSLALDTKNTDMFWPRRLHKQVVDLTGQIPTVSLCGANGKDAKYVESFSLNCWEHYCDWQARALLNLVHANNYEVVFSHLHNVDSMGHGFWGLAMTGNEGVTKEQARSYIEKTYVDTDNYIGTLMNLLDEGWSIIVTSDHGLLVRNEEYPAIGDPFGVNAKVMNAMGYTALKKNAKGKFKREIDWEHTTAVAARGNHIYINLKGRDKHGIVDPADKYALEDKLITDLYNLRTPDGQRMIGLVLRNKEAALLGMDGPECGDLIYFLAEGPNRVHGDSLSTYYGLFDSSVSPIFVAAGEGIKQNYKMERVVRSVDVTPTVAALLDVRMPEQCEGAPVYQILE